MASDAAVSSLAEDEFDRIALATRVAAEIRAAPLDGGFVIGLCGPWGSGKSSVASMAIELLDVDEEDEMLLVPFSPWMFSDAVDLVQRFLDELTRRFLKGPRRLRRLAGYVSRYAGALARGADMIPTAGPYVMRGLRVLERVAAPGRARTLDETYARLSKKLAGVRQRILVVIDDVDRLADSEVRDIVRLVKSVGALPNLVYLLMFDRAHVEVVLGHPLTGAAGRARGQAYLEKIVQIRHDVPVPRRPQLDAFLSAHLAPVLRPYERLVPDGRDLEEVLAATSALVGTPRDAKRVANAVSAGLDLHADEVSVADIVGIEALRVLEPNLHARLSDLEDVLLGWDLDGEKAQRSGAKRLDEAFAGSARTRAVSALLGVLFPDAGVVLGTARKVEDADVERAEKRLAVDEVFSRYVHASLDETEIPAAEVERVAAAMGNAERLAAMLARHRGERLAELLARLPGYQLPVRDEEAGVVARLLLESMEALPAKHSLFSSDWHVASSHGRRLLVRVLAADRDAGRRRVSARALVEAPESLSERRVLLDWLGTFRRDKGRDEVGPLDEADTRALSAQLAELTLAADTATLGRERRLTALLQEAVVQGGGSLRARLVERAQQEPDFMLLLLREVTSSVGRDGVRYMFDWQLLVELLGEPAAQERLLSLVDEVDLETLDEHARAGLLEGVAIARGDKEPPTGVLI